MAEGHQCPPIQRFVNWYVYPWGYGSSHQEVCKQMSVMMDAKKVKTIFVQARTNNNHPHPILKRKARTISQIIILHCILFC